MGDEADVGRGLATRRERKIEGEIGAERAPEVSVERDKATRATTYGLYTWAQFMHNKHAWGVLAWGPVVGAR